jgi:hypothetical protein
MPALSRTARPSMLVMLVVQVDVRVRCLVVLVQV